jgi:protein gp37
VAWRFYRNHLVKIDPDWSSARDQFEPWFYPERLGEPAKVRKPSRIFVCSMGDLFGDWAPLAWTAAVLNRTQRADYQHHTYIFLTKNPKRYQFFNPWPENCWLGATITNQADAEDRIPELLKADAPVRFVSAEPLFGPITLNHYFMQDEFGNIGQKFVGDFEKPSNALTWLIIGAMTGPDSKAHQPDPEWIQSLIKEARVAGVPVFLKSNLKWPEKIEEYPTLMKGREE